MYFTRRLKELRKCCNLLETSDQAVLYINALSSSRQPRIVCIGISRSVMFWQGSLVYSWQYIACANLVVILEFSSNNFYQHSEEV